MLRLTPDPDERYDNIPDEILQEIRGLFAKCYVSTTVGGTGYGHTKDKQIAKRLDEGWFIGDYTNGVGQTTPIWITCSTSKIGEFTMNREPDAPTYYDFNIPPALISLVREMNDGEEAT